MPHPFRRRIAPPLFRDSARRRFASGVALGAILLTSASTVWAGSTDRSVDVSAPPMALLFGMAVLGLLLGRRR